MDIEITSTLVTDGIVFIFGVDVSDENLRRMQRLKDDVETEVKFCFDTHEPADLKYLRTWLKNQKATKDSKTWGEALNSIIGTITVIAPRFRSWA